MCHKYTLVSFLSSISWLTSYLWLYIAQPNIMCHIFQQQMRQAKQKMWHFVLNEIWEKLTMKH